MIWSLVSSLMAGVLQQDHLYQKVKEIDLLLEDGEIAFIFFPLKSGEAMLMKNEAGKTILVNTGGPSTAKQLQGWLKRFNVQHIDMIVITNKEKHYTANLPWLMHVYRVEKVVAAEQIFQEKEHKKKATIWNTGEHYEVLPGLVIEVLYKYKGTLNLSLKYGDLRILYMSSGEEAVEKQLKTMPLKDVNILKVADFASGNRPSNSFLKSIDPQVAIIFRKEGILPNQQLLERLYHLWIEIYQIGRSGMITIKCDLNHYQIITFD
jgi:competence protein ComEC